MAEYVEEVNSVWGIDPTAAGRAREEVQLHEGREKFVLAGNLSEKEAVMHLTRHGLYRRPDQCKYRFRLVTRAAAFRVGLHDAAQVVARRLQLQLPRCQHPSATRSQFVGAAPLFAKNRSARLLP